MEIFLRLLIFILAVIYRVINPKINHKPCFLRKKNLSLKLELASANEEMEIKASPMPVKAMVSGSSGDLILVR